MTYSLKLHQGQLEREMYKNFPAQATGLDIACVNFQNWAMSRQDKHGKLPAPPSGLSHGDIAHSTLKAAMGLIPIAGGAISEVVDKAVVAPSEKRMEVWLGLVADAINELNSEIDGLTPETLGNNEAFVTAVISTTRSALLSSRDEKLLILKSVIKTTGSGIVIDDFLRNSFLTIVERYTPEHVTLLQRCGDVEHLDLCFELIKNDETVNLSAEATTPSHVQVEKLIPKLLPEVRAEIAMELFTDLHSDRLCSGSEGFARLYYPKQDQAIATVRGKEFLRFVFSNQEPR